MTLIGYPASEYYIYANERKRVAVPEIQAFWINSVRYLSNTSASQFHFINVVFPYHNSAVTGLELKSSALTVGVAAI
jgi:hypothetical protein